MNWSIEQSAYFLGLLAIAGMLHGFTIFFARCGYCAWRDRLSVRKGR
jgi:hypothetical protein